MFKISRSILPSLNSMTKYPSIPTYHRIGEKGILSEDREVCFDAREDIYISEKIDGCNARIILFPDGDWIIGTRDELIHYKNDLIYNPVLGVVETFLSNDAAFCPNLGHVLPRFVWDVPIVMFFECYGKGINGGKEYSSSKTSYRLFDLAVLQNFDELISKTPAELASWRDNGGQVFLSASMLHCVKLPVTPRLGKITSSSLPVALEATEDFMKSLIPESQATIDDTGHKKPEGIVVRNEDRTKIAKLRFDDYRRSLRSKK